MFTKVTKRSRSMREWRVGAFDVDAHGPGHERCTSASTGSEPGRFEVSDPTLKVMSWQAVHIAELAVYCERRPLPHSPPPKPVTPATLNMPPARPSTSGGPNAKASAFLGFPTISPAKDQKMSIDDMSLNKSWSNKGLQPYKTGVIGGHSAASGARGAISDTFSPPSAVRERILSPVTLSSADTPIGMALGSPAHPPETWETWRPRELPSSQPPLVVPDLFEPFPEPPVQRQKTQRRKLFGNLFGSRKASEPTGKGNREFSDSNASLSTTSPGTHHEESTFTRTKTVADRKIPKHKPIIIRSNTFSQPYVDTFDHDWRSGRVAGGIDAPKTAAAISVPPTAAEPLDSSSVAGSFLNVEIPSIKMERYSIMFGSVLDKTDSSSSSLLARRQATLERLKTINERIQKEEEEKERLRERRASSPQFAKSPGFALFPFPPSSEQQPSPASPPRRPDARYRSYTSPANLPTPVKATFDLEVAKKERKTVTIISPRTMEQHKLATIPRSRSQESIGESIASTVDGEFAAFHFGPDVSGFILDSPKGLHSPDSSRRPSVADNQPAKPASGWPTITPDRVAAAASSPPSSTTTSTHRSASSSGSSVNTHLTRPSLDIDESDTALKAAVEISIARQISISRQQRTLLRPLRTEIAQMPSPSRSSSRPGTKVSPIEKVHISKTEGRVVETKSSTPTLVVPRETLENYPAAHRKSERVVMLDAGAFETS